jgi:hypothetical protein
MELAVGFLEIGNGEPKVAFGCGQRAVAQEILYVAQSPDQEQVSVPCQSRLLVNCRVKEVGVGDDS